MIQPLTVTETPGVTQAGASVSYLPETAPDVHLELFDYGFKLSKPLTAGKHTIHVMNIGTQEHEAVLMKLVPGKTMKDADAWFESGMKGPSPHRTGPRHGGPRQGSHGQLHDEPHPREIRLDLLHPRREGRQAALDARHGAGDHRRGEVS